MRPAFHLVVLIACSACIAPPADATHPAHDTESGDSDPAPTDADAPGDPGADADGDPSPADTDEPPPEPPLVAIIDVVPAPDVATVHLTLDSTCLLTVTCDGALGPPPTTAGPGPVTLELGGLSASTTYTLTVTAQNAAQLSASAEVQFTTSACDAPAAVTGLRMQGLVAPDPPLEVATATTTLTLLWDASASPYLEGYELFIAGEPDMEDAELLATTSAPSFAHARSDVGYAYYAVRAVTRCGSQGPLGASAGAARYPIGNILPLHAHAALTGAYPERESYPYAYAPRTRFLKIDVSDRAAGAAYPVEGGTPSSVKLAPNFRLYEFVWGGGQSWLEAEYSETFGYAVVDPLAVSYLQELRELFDAPLSLNSAYRSPERNAAIGGATYSRHMYGDAFDIDTPNDAAGAVVWQELESYACQDLTDDADFVEPWYDDSVDRVCAPSCGSLCTNGWLHTDWRWQVPEYRPFDGVADRALFGCLGEASAELRGP